MSRSPGATGRIPNLLLADAVRVPEFTYVFALGRLYAPLADQWVIYDNSDPSPRLVARAVAGKKIELLEPETWRRILEVAK